VLFKKKSIPAPVLIAVEPTLEDRLADANIAASVHLSAFVRAATGLEKAADDLDAVRDHAAEEATRHLDIKVTADKTAFQHRAQAQKIRDLLL
jgi:hypothetical protein